MWAWNTCISKRVWFKPCSKIMKANMVTCLFSLQTLPYSIYHLKEYQYSSENNSHFVLKGWDVADKIWAGKMWNPPWTTSRSWGGATDAVPGGKRTEDLEGKNNSPASRRNTSDSREVRASKSEPAAFLVLFSANSLLQVLRLASSNTGATVSLS